MQDFSSFEKRIYKTCIKSFLKENYNSIPVVHVSWSSIEYNFVQKYQNPVNILDVFAFQQETLMGFT